MGFRLDLQAFAPACSYYCLIIGVLYQSIYFVTRCRAVLFYAAAVLWVKSQYWLTFHGQSDILNIVNKGVNALKGMHIRATHKHKKAKRKNKHEMIKRFRKRSLMLRAL